MYDDKVMTKSMRQSSPHNCSLSVFYALSTFACFIATHPLPNRHLPKRRDASPLASDRFGVCNLPGDRKLSFLSYQRYALPFTTHSQAWRRQFSARPNMSHRLLTNTYKYKYIAICKAWSLSWSSPGTGFWTAARIRVRGVEGHKVVWVLNKFIH